MQHFFSKEKNGTHPVNVQSGQQGGQAWRDEPQAQPQAVDEPANTVQAQPDAPRTPQGSAVPKSRSRLLFRITPGDAAVYLNDTFVGTGEELSTLARGLQVPPGQHTITVSRPGLATREQTVVVGPGKSETVEIALEKN